jgi:hypothetical protein
MKGVKRFTPNGRFPLGRLELFRFGEQLRG